MPDYESVDPRNLLRAAILDFLEGRTEGSEGASKIEMVVARYFGGDPQIEDLESALALYSPIGGPFLLGDAELSAECRLVLKMLETD